VSADNYGVVAQHPLTGKWHLLMGFASDDEFVPAVRHGYATVGEAEQAAMEEYFEYGRSYQAWPNEWREYCDHCGDYSERFMLAGKVHDASGRVVVP
jgi:hypothetical protein